MAVFHRECCETTAGAIRIGLTHARLSGSLTSYDDDASYIDGRLTVMLLANRMHPSDRHNFGCERLIAERVIDKGMALHRTSVRPPTMNDNDKR